MSKEIIDLLEKISERCSIIESNAVNHNVMEQIHILTGYRQGVGRNDGSGIVDQALTLAKRMPKRIPLTQGKFAIVDADKFEYLNQWKWQAVKKFNIWYAQRSTAMVNGHRETVYMHQEILKTPNGMETDHRDGNGLNNQVNNIRICTPSQNQHNQKPQIGKSSRYKGVGWNKSDKRWQSRIKINGKTKHIGNYKDEIEAARAYDKKALEIFGEFAYLNFPDCQQPTAGEFTKKVRTALGTALQCGRATGYLFDDEELYEIKKLCDRLDRAEAENGKLLDTIMAAGFIGQGTQIIGDKRYEELKRAEAINKELLKACEFAKAQIKKGSQKKALPILRAAIAKAKKEG